MTTSLIDSTAQEAIAIWERDKEAALAPEKRVCPECHGVNEHRLPSLYSCAAKAEALAPEKHGHTILIHVWIESPEDAGADTITPGKLEFEIKSAIMRSNRIIDAIEIDKIEVEADMNYAVAR